MSLQCCAVRARYEVFLALALRMTARATYSASYLLVTTSSSWSMGRGYFNEYTWTVCWARVRNSQLSQVPQGAVPGLLMNDPSMLCGQSTIWRVFSMSASHDRKGHRLCKLFYSSPYPQAGLLDTVIFMNTLKLFVELVFKIPNFLKYPKVLSWDW